MFGLSGRVGGADMDEEVASIVLEVVEGKDVLSDGEEADAASAATIVVSRECYTSCICDQLTCRTTSLPRLRRRRGGHGDRFTVSSSRRTGVGYPYLNGSERSKKKESRANRVVCQARMDRNLSGLEDDGWLAGWLVGIISLGCDDVCLGKSGD